MPEVLRKILRGLFVVAGLIVIYMIINSVVETTRESVQQDRDNNANANIIMSTLSATPFGVEIDQAKRGQQIFYNFTIKRNPGHACFVQTSWRWVLHLPTGNSVMWNTDDGQFYAGDKNENLAQAVIVPTNLLPGDYTLSRLSVFKCGSVMDYAKTVRNTELKIIE